MECVHRFFFLGRGKCVSVSHLFGTFCVYSEVEESLHVNLRLPRERHTCRKPPASWEGFCECVHPPLKLSVLQLHSIYHTCCLVLNPPIFSMNSKHLPHPPLSTYSLQLVPPPHIATNQWEPPCSGSIISRFFGWPHGMCDIEEFQVHCFCVKPFTLL